MGVIVFSSLKGGVGKTSLSLNVAHAFAFRGCKTLLIDLDPAGHATSVCRQGTERAGSPQGSPLARLFLSQDGAHEFAGVDSERLPVSDLELIVPVRPYFELLSAGAELRYFFWGQGPRAFIRFFPRLMAELKAHYDHIVIDTPPDLNVLTRNAIAVGDVVAVPVDSSRMSILSLEELIISCQHIKGPTWSICRTMVNHQATRVRRLSSSRLGANLDLHGDNEHGDESAGRAASGFIDMLREQEEARVSTPAHGGENDNSPIYLLKTMVSRTENQNRLTFQGKTAFDSRATSKLAAEYLGVARELERILELSCPEPLEDSDNSMYLNQLL
ncbi:MAG: ParA family protein [Bdellovibrionales bacterium]|nr:ParA family protein [Bdellovibrionales bacterium]